MNLVSSKQSLQPFNNNHLGGTKSLSDLFRTYTQSNLIIEDEVSEAEVTGIPIDAKVDMRNPAQLPSNRALADQEIHNILNDAMFKPVKKVSNFHFSLSLLWLLKH